MANLQELVKRAHEEKHRLLWLRVRRIEWNPNGEHRVQFYHFLQAPKNNTGSGSGGGPGGPKSTKPSVFPGKTDGLKLMSLLLVLRTVV